VDIAEILTKYEQYKYALIFLLAIPEGTILPLICGFLITIGFLHPITTYILIVLGDAVSDFIFYMLGKFSAPVAAYLYPKIGITEERIAYSAQQFESNCLRVIAMSKLMSSLGIVGLVAAGTLRVSYGKFFSSCLLVSLCRIELLLVLGFLFGRVYEQNGSYFNYYVIGIVIVVLFIIYIVRRSKKLS
jgi:membrane protein DedA with SNARE-associated domain